MPKKQWISQRSFNNYFLTVCLFLTSTLYVQGQIFDHNLKGKWVGSVDLKPYPDLMSVSVDSVSSIKLFYNDIGYTEISDFSLINDSIHILVNNDEVFLQFEGKLMNNELIAGKVTLGNGTYPCNLMKLDPAGLDDLGYMIGYFNFEDGRVIQMEPFFLDGTMNPLSILDFSNGKKRVAFPVQSDDRKIKYIAGEKMVTPVPGEFAITLHKDSIGQALRLEYNDFKTGESLQQGKVMQNLVDIHDFTAKNKDIKIQGSITYPNVKEGKHPLVIFVPGAGEQFRGNLFNDYIKLLPYYGIATLEYDKRGCGQSNGDRFEATFEDFAQDLLAVIEEAKKEDRIDTSRIGLVGFDQASYVMPIAASMSDDIQFMVMLSGAVTSLQEQEYAALQNRLEADGFLEEDVVKALEYQSSLFDYLDSQIDSASFQQLSDQMHSTHWAPYVTSFDNKIFMDWWKRMYDFDPAIYWEQVDIPVLAIYGENDLLLKADQNAKRMKKMIHRQKTKESKVILYPKANHLLILGEKRGDFQISEIEGYIPSLFREINEWIGEQTGMIK